MKLTLVREFISSDAWKRGWQTLTWMLKNKLVHNVSIGARACDWNKYVALICWRSPTVCSSALELQFVCTHVLKTVYTSKMSRRHVFGSQKSEKALFKPPRVQSSCINDFMAYPSPTLPLPPSQVRQIHSSGYLYCIPTVLSVLQPCCFDS